MLNFKGIFWTLSLQSFSSFLSEIVLDIYFDYKIVVVNCIRELSIEWLALGGNHLVNEC